MPIFEAPGAEAPEVVKAEEPKAYVCTLSPDDKGEECRYCGHLSGPGHGKAR